VGLRDVVRLSRSAAELEAAATVTTDATRTVGVASWEPRGNLEAIVWSELFDLTALPVNRAEAIALPPVARARHILGTIARIPLVELDENGDELDPQPTWLRRDDSDVSPFHRTLATVDDHLFYGESLWALERGSDGYPLRATHVPWDQWDVDDAGRIVDLDGRPYPARSVAHIPGPHEGLLSFGARTIRQGTALAKAAGETARAPFRVELHNTSDLELDDAEISALITRARTALDQNGGILYTSRSVEAKVHPVNPEQLLIEGRNAVALDVARLVGLPAAVLDSAGPSSMTYTNSPAKLAEAVDFGLGLYMAAITARLSLDDLTPRGRRVRFELETLLSPGATSSGVTTPAPTPNPTQTGTPTP
jgi:hypothetical protein